MKYIKYSCGRISLPDAKYPAEFGTSPVSEEVYYNDQDGTLYSNYCCQGIQEIMSYVLKSDTLQQTADYSWKQNYDLGHGNPTEMKNVYLLEETDINHYVFQNSSRESGTGEFTSLEEFIAAAQGINSNQNQSEEDKHLVTEAPQQQETTPPAAAASEDTLKEQVLSKCGNSPLDWYYDDFDGDGNKEAFAMA